MYIYIHTHTHTHIQECEANMSAARKQNELFEEEVTAVQESVVPAYIAAKDALNAATDELIQVGTCMPVCMYVCCVYVCMYVCVCIYIYIYIYRNL